MADEPQDPSERDETKEPEKGEDLAATVRDLKAALKKANKEAETFRRQLKDKDDQDKTEVEKLRDELVAVTKDRDGLRTDKLRLEVAVSKGLSPSQAKRLHGETQEELEADADEFLESIRPGDNGKPPGGKPKEDLRGGGDPSEEPEEMDPRKLADMVPRY